MVGFFQLQIVAVEFFIQFFQALVGIYHFVACGCYAFHLLIHIEDGDQQEDGQQADRD